MARTGLIGTEPSYDLGQLDRVKVGFWMERRDYFEEFGITRDSEHYIREAVYFLSCAPRLKSRKIGLKGRARVTSHPKRS